MDLEQHGMPNRNHNITPCILSENCVNSSESIHDDCDTTSSKHSSIILCDSYDISSSSLIKSPLIVELLAYHGLLKKNKLEEISLKVPDSENQFCSLDDNYGPPSFLRIYSLQPPNSLIDENEEDEEGDYHCGWESCDMCFSCRKELAQHVNSSHIYQDENSLYRCQWNGCIRQGKAINARYRMLIHVRTHTHEKPHSCDACGKKFSRLENLRIHIRSHTGEKPYACPVAGCSKAYSNSSDRFKHSKTHQEDKPYVCRVEGCDKRYTDPSSLRKHMKSVAHGGDVGAKSTSGHQLSIPLDMHPEKNVSINVENNKCNSMLQKLPHTKNYEGNRPYACKVEGCGKRYTDPSSLRKHQRATSHGRDPLTWNAKYLKYKPGKGNTKVEAKSCSTYVPLNGIQGTNINTTAKCEDLKDILQIQNTNIGDKLVNIPDFKPLDLSINYSELDKSVNTNSSANQIDGNHHS